MPATTKWKQLLAELEEQNHKVQHAQLEGVLFSDDSDDSSLMGSYTDLLDGTGLLDHEIDSDLDLEKEEADLESLLVNLEAELLGLELNLDNSDLDIDRSNLGSMSPSVSDIKDDMHDQWSAQLQELTKIVQTTHVLDPTPPNPKAPQFHLLDHWQEHNIWAF